MKTAADIGLEGRDGAEQVLDEDLIDDDQHSLEIQQSAVLGVRGQLHELLVLPRQQRLPRGHAGWAAGPHQPQLNESQDQDGEANDDSSTDAKPAHEGGDCNNCAN